MSLATMGDSIVDFLVRKQDLGECKFVTRASGQDVELRPGQVLLSIEKFGLTSNNITYAMLGDNMGYWNFFPAEAGWGRIPVWGYGVVARSNHAEIVEGECFYGYYPTSTHLVADLARVNSEQFIDVSAGRRALPEVYNRYTRRRSGSISDPDGENLEVLLRPLLTTAYLLDDFLEQNGFFGAHAIVLSSASSKTALGLAYLLSRRTDRPYKVVGLTSAANGDFVERYKFFDQAVPYDRVSSLPTEQPIVFVDLAGNGQVLRSVHRHFSDQIKYSCRVGLTHWQSLSPDEALPGPQPTLFFAPAQSDKRMQEWGPEVFRQRFERAWGELAEMASHCIAIVHGHGQEALRRVYLDVLAGRAKPEQGHVQSW
jgi:Protein of unknown function (DUF2855)